MDAYESLVQARRLLSTEETLADEDTRLDRLIQPLLPEWDDDWLLLERERMHQMHLLALEALSKRLWARGQYARAVEAGLAAVAAEPLRASAHNALIAAHLGQGNIAEAHRQYERYARLLWSELELTPTHTFSHLMDRYGSGSADGHLERRGQEEPLPRNPARDLTPSSGDSSY